MANPGETAQPAKIETRPEATPPQAVESLIKPGETGETAVARLDKDHRDAAAKTTDEGQTSVAQAVETGKKAGLNVA